MKPFLILLFVCVSFCCKSNAIDKLKNLDDVRAFLKSKLRKDKKIDFFVSDKQDSQSKLANLKYLKIDLNNDGLTDLLVNGTYLFAMIDEGDNYFKASFIDRGTFMFKKYTLADIDSTAKQPKIIVKAYNSRRGSAESSAIYDTLVFKFGGFVEYCDWAVKNDIEKISITTTRCFGTCPVFELSVDSDRTALYKALQYNDRKGTFGCEIEKGAFDKLFGLANYIQLRSLNDKYRVNWTDDQTAQLTITYTDGTVKFISDYGLIGTFGLQRLYEQFFSLRNSQKWAAL